MIAGLVKGGEGVAISANTLKKIEVVGGTETISPTEHHVLEQVSEAATTSGFIRAADVVPDLHGHDGATMIFEG